MTQIALPADQAAQLSHQRQRQAAIAQARYEVAKEIMGHLIGFEYHRAIAAAHHEQNRFDTGQADEDDDGSLEIALELGCPARIAVQAADALLVELGLVQPPAKPAINPGPR